MKGKILVAGVVGPTASGKTRLGVALAKRLDGEVISADSMQVYKGMTVGTAKPTQEEMEGVPHHLLDFLDPGEAFSVAAWCDLAREKIAEITGRGKLPILVGGTGLYLLSPQPYPVRSAAKRPCPSRGAAKAGRKGGRGRASGGTSRL